MDEEEGIPTASAGVWIGLSFIAIVSFWSQATVTEERFVPSLNLISNYFNIPDDVAGATLMAAGASSPELFSSIVSLFITHSALGLGTIVGSEIFNQMVICAGAVYASKSGSLKLDKAVLAREVGFYALAIGLLLWALQDTRPTDDDDVEDHIYITFFRASFVFGAYILYILVCAYFDAIVAIFGSGKKQKKSITASENPSYGAIPEQKRSKRAIFDFPDMPFFKEGEHADEPGDNFADKPNVTRLYRTPDAQEIKGVKSGTREFVLTKSGLETHQTIVSHDPVSRFGSLRGSIHRSVNSDLLEESLRDLSGKFSDGSSLRVFDVLVNTEKPSDIHGLYEMKKSEFDETISCFLWQRSMFYNKARFVVHGWHLRWFTFTHDQIYSIADRTESEKYVMTYPSLKEMEVDVARHIFKIKNPVKEKRPFYVMAPNDEIFKAVMKKCEDIMETRAEIGYTERPSKISSEFPKDGDTSDERSLIAFPIGEGNFALLTFIILFPLRFLMHWTVPDVRHLDANGNPTATLKRAFISSFMCFIWLIVGSYAMVASLENLAKLMDIPDAVIGVTVSAAGTSLPNYIASKIAAEQGFGNMAVSNAFGSNTFNIMVGLGLPWVLYTSFGTGFEPYHGLRNDGIIESVIILASVLIIFILVVLQSGCILYRWHGHLFLAIYVSYLAFSIGQVYL